MTQPRLFLLDVEGTLAPLSLTNDHLFPYARARFESFLVEGFKAIESREGNFDQSKLLQDTFIHDLLLLQMENRAEKDSRAPRILPLGADSASPSYLLPKALEYIYWLMDHDRKSTALNSMQGKIWKAGFASGEIKGTIFDDVPRAFARWSPHAKIAIYSSGSVEAQHLLFRHSVFGDLTPYISAYFDTHIGQKTLAASYAAIAQTMQVSTSEACFFSDVTRELDPAREAGMDTRLVCRAGNPSVASSSHPNIQSLDGLP